MIEGKKGRQYEFPESFIKIQAVWHQWVNYSIEGIAMQEAHALQRERMSHSNIFTAIKGLPGYWFMESSLISGT